MSNGSIFDLVDAEELLKTLHSIDKSISRIADRLTEDKNSGADKAPDGNESK